MNRNDDFETIWIEFSEGRFEELSQDELDRLSERGIPVDVVFRQGVDVLGL